MLQYMHMRARPSGLRLLSSAGRKYASNSFSVIYFESSVSIA